MTIDLYRKTARDALAGASSHRVSPISEKATLTPASTSFVSARSSPVGTFRENRRRSPSRRQYIASLHSVRLSSLGSPTYTATDCETVCPFCVVTIYIGYLPLAEMAPPSLCDRPLILLNVGPLSALTISEALVLKEFPESWALIYRLLLFCAETTPKLSKGYDEADWTVQRRILKGKESLRLRLMSAFVFYVWVLPSPLSLLLCVPRKFQ